MLAKLRWAATGPWGMFDVHACVAVGIQAAKSVPIRKLKVLASLHPEKLPEIPDTQPLANDATPSQRVARAKEQTAVWARRVREQMSIAF